MLQMQFLENRVALELTRSDFVEAEEVNHRLFFPIFVYSLLLPSPRHGDIEPAYLSKLTSSVWNYA